MDKFDDIAYTVSGTLIKLKQPVRDYKTGKLCGYQCQHDGKWTVFITIDDLKMNDRIKKDIETIESPEERMSKLAEQLKAPPTGFVKKEEPVIADTPIESKIPVTPVSEVKVRKPRTSKADMIIRRAKEAEEAKAKGNKVEEPKKTKAVKPVKAAKVDKKDKKDKPAKATRAKEVKPRIRRTKEQIAAGMSLEQVAALAKK